MKALLRHKASIQRYLFEHLNVKNMPIDLFTLTFPSDLEERFRKDSYSATLRILRGALFIGVVLYALFAFLDYMVLFEVLKVLFIIRFYIVIPVILIVFALSFTTIFFQWWQVFMLIAIFFAAIGIIAMTVVSPVFGRNAYYSGIMLVLFFNYISRVRFVWATLMGWLILFCYWLSTVLFSGLSDKVLIVNVFFLTSVNLMGMFASYSIEFFIRKNYYFRLLLDDERCKVIRSNEVLEDKVKEKTLSLQNDIESRKKVEEALIIAKEKAEESNRLKTAFLHNMSHEIRTPMNGIMGFSELLVMVDPESAKFKSYLSTVKVSANRLINTVDNLIAISQIDTGQMDLTIEHFDLFRLLDDLVVSFLGKCEKKGLTLKLHKDQDASLDLFTDKNKYKAILENLIKNAIKFTDKGSVFISCSCSDGAKVEVMVEDTGIGIPLCRQEAIFNRFEKSDIEDSRAHQGSGLGLSLSRAYALMMNGDITVESEPGVGSKFKFCIKR